MEVEVQCVIFSLCLLFAITKARWQGRLGAVHPNLHLHLWHAGGEGCPARALRALGLLLADSAPTVGGGKTF